jgi:hypothetical protein
VSSANHFGFDSASAYFGKKDKFIVFNSGPLQPAVEEYEADQEGGEIAIEEPYDGLEIIEQSALDHFNSILHKAQRAAAQAEKEKPQKCPRRYNGKSARTLKRHKKCQEDLVKKGYFPVLRLSSYLVFTRFAYASYLPYLYNWTVSTVYQTHFGLCHYLDT